MMDIHKAFMRGAQILAQNNCKYTELHKGHGIDPYHWEILTQQEYWTPDQARAMTQILAAALEVSMTIANMPAVPLPGQYTAAFIATVVAPANRMMACMKAPDMYDANAAAGLMETHRVEDMSRQQLMALVILYSADFIYEPSPHKLPSEVKETMKKDAKA